MRTGYPHGHSSAASVFLERLEERRFMSASLQSHAPLAHDVTPKLIAKPTILRPSQVEGNYDGKFTVSSGGRSQSLNVVFTVRSNSVTISFTGYGSYRVPINPAQFRKLRDGNFKATRVVNGETVSVTWTVSESGKKFAGTFDVAGSVSGTGSFTVRKVS